METSVYGRLSLMMFLQYAVWGAWLPLAGRYLSATPTEGGLGFSGDQIGWILGLGGSIGALAAPFIAGQIADRYFNTERCLAVLVGLGGVIQWITAEQTSYAAWLWLSVAYSILYMPTLALSNSLAFAHLDDRTRQFPYVRVWGSIGWIAASWVFPMIWLQTDLSLSWMPPFLIGSELPAATARLALALKFSGSISLAYAVFALLLPSTPPRRDAVEPLAFARAFRLLGNPAFSVLVLVSLPISMIHQIYFIQTGPFLSSIGLKVSQIGPAMTVGQFAEICMMPLLGFLLKRLGFRTVITIGALAYFCRFAVFGTTTLPATVIVGSLVLHGICYSCFFAAAFIFVDRLAPKDVRHSAQTLFGILILGGGPILGGWLSGVLAGHYQVLDGAVDFSSLWYTVAIIGLVCAAAFFALFRDVSTRPQPSGVVA